MGLNVKGIIVQHLLITESPWNLRLEKEFLDLTPKLQIIKEKTINWIHQNYHLLFQEILSLEDEKTNKIGEIFAKCYH